MEPLYEIFVDSSAGLTEAQADANNIQVISYTLNLDGEDLACYEKGRDNQAVAQRVFTALREGKEVRTSLINEQQIIDAVSPALAEGKNVLFICISAKLSGTHNQALMASETLKSLYPNRTFAVVDSLNASAGEGMLALKAAQLRDLGESFSTCVDWLENNKSKMNAYCTVDDLKYLRKGGRISAATAIAGTLLNIKPILLGDGSGKFAIAGKERGRRKALASLAEAFRANVIAPQSQTIAISHCDCLEDAQQLAEMLKGLGAQDIMINYYDVCTGAHIGPGTIALFFMGKDRKDPEREVHKSPLIKAITHKA
jgi:DegV family protein with EDD domain